MDVVFWKGGAEVIVGREVLEMPEAFTPVAEEVMVDDEELEMTE